MEIVNLVIGFKKKRKIQKKFYRNYMNTFSTPREQNIIIKCSLKSYKFAEKKCWSMFHHFIKNVINLFKITKLPEALPQQFHSIDFF